MKDAVRGLKKFFQPRPQYITRSVGCEGGERSLALTGTALPEKMPRHVAIIMDGNGRWATRRGLPRSAGHAAGTEALRDIIRATDDWGIEALNHLRLFHGELVPGEGRGAGADGASAEIFQF